MQTLHAALRGHAEKVMGVDCSPNPSPWVPHVTLGKFGRAVEDTEHQVDVARAIDACLEDAAAALTELQQAGKFAVPINSGGLEMREAPNALMGIDWSAITVPV